MKFSTSRFRNAETLKQALKTNIPPNSFALKPSFGNESVILEKVAHNNLKVTIISPLNIKSKSPFEKSKCKITTKSHPKDFYFFFSIRSMDHRYAFNDFCGICKILLGLLVVESFFFSSSKVSSLDPVDMSSLTSSYCGPRLTQGQLIKTLFDEISTLNRDTVYHISNPSYFHCNFVEAFFTKCVHQPVHTTTESITESVYHLLALFGIDDSLSTFIASELQTKRIEEKEKWLQSVRHVFTKT